MRRSSEKRDRDLRVAACAGHRCAARRSRRAAGVKFKDADLIGIPYRITVGKKLAQGMVEFVQRRGKTSFDVPVDEAASAVQKAIAS